MGAASRFLAMGKVTIASVQELRPATARIADAVGDFILVYFWGANFEAQYKIQLSSNIQETSINIRMPSFMEKDVAGPQAESKWRAGQDRRIPY
jgi:hypothetical protein